MKWQIISTRAITEQFSVWDTFWRRPKTLTYYQISQKYIFTFKLSYQNQGNSIIGSFLRRQRLIKEGCADLRTCDINRVKWVRQQLCTVILREFFLRSIYHCSKWYQSHKGDIPRTRSMFAEIVAAAEHYLIITHVKIKQPYRICLLVESAVERMSTKTEKKNRT